MRRTIAVLISLVAAACSNPDDPEGQSCGPNDPCPSGFTCDPRNNKCTKSGNIPDARLPDAKPADAGTGDAASPTDARPVDAAAPPPDARLTDAASPPDAAPPADGSGGSDAPSQVATVEITGGGEGGLCGGMETFTYSSPDTSATFECGLDGAFMACAASGETFTLADGTTHMFQVRAVNAAGTGPVATRTCTVDATAPVVTISSPAPGSTQGAMTQVDFTVNETATQACTLNGNPLATCETGMKLTLDAGMYTLVITATDPAGNVGMATVMFTVAIAGPTAEISFPTQDAITGPTVNFDFAGGAGTVRTECTIDGSPIDCDPPTLEQIFEVGGEHTFTVQAFDAGDHGGAVASVGFIVDASPPVFSNVTTTQQKPGTVRIDFQLTDLSDITSISCALDGGAFVECGAGEQGTITYTELTPGPHIFEIFAVDQWGNSGQTSIETGVPGSRVQVNFSQVPGAGHLVLIGHDYFVSIIPKNPQQQVPPLEQLLINTVAQSPAVGFSRGANVAILNVNADPSELKNVETILDANLNVNLVEIGLDQVATAVLTSDVLLVPDQEGAFQPGNSDAALLEPALRAFLDAGGVVGVLDGTFVNGSEQTVPSRTYSILDPSLLAIIDTDAWEGCASVPCNDADPLLDDGVGSEICGAGHLVEYLTLEPWITMSHRVQVDEAFVLHKWFGTTNDVAPIGLSIGTSVFGNFEGWDVFFQRFDGTSERACTTLSNGTAVHMMQPDGFLSFGLDNDGNRILITAVDVQPLDHVTFAPPQGSETGSFFVFVNLPGGVTDATSYRVMLGCAATTSQSFEDIGISMPDTCFNQDGSYNIIGEALGDNGEILAYTMLNGVTQEENSAIDMPAWKSPNFHPVLGVGGLTDVDSVELSISLFADGIEYNEAGGPATRGATGGTFDFYSEAGTGAPTYGVLSHSETVTFNQARGEMGAAVQRIVRGPRINALNVNLAGVMLPRLDQPTLTFDANDRLTVTWGAPGSFLNVDGGILQLVWLGDGTINQWLVVMPPGPSVALPPNPGEETSSRFWPTPNDDPQLGLVELIESNVIPGYAVIRQNLLSVTTLPPGNFTLRTTTLTAASQNFRSPSLIPSLR